MAVFENESNASQDANYREHLNRNWDNGNSAFDNLFGKYNNLLDKYNDIVGRLNDDENEIHDLQDKNIALNQRCDKIEEKHNDDIKALTEKHNDDIKTLTEKHNDDIKALTEKHNDDIKAVQEQLDRLNNVVFGHVHEVNYDKPQKQDPHDYYEVIDKSKNNHPLNKDPVSHELNYSTINGKHNSIEIDTGIGNMKGEEL